MTTTKVAISQDEFFMLLDQLLESFPSDRAIPCLPAQVHGPARLNFAEIESAPEIEAFVSALRSRALV